MINKTELYSFSPTGGTKKVAQIVAYGIGKEVKMVDLVKKMIPNPTEDVIVVAAPVFGGRLPSVVPEKLKNLDGHGKKAVTVAVYGVRAYEDALLELNELISACGFQVVASAALVAQHSIAKEVGAGRPDAADCAEIKKFAEDVLDKLEKNDDAPVLVPGNSPYKEGMNVSVTPISLEHCNGCGVCAAACPTDAIEMISKKPETALEKCMMCMACVAHCPMQARILPPPVQQMMNEKLGVLKNVRRENEFYC